MVITQALLLNSELERIVSGTADGVKDLVTAGRVKAELAWDQCVFLIEEGLRKVLYGNYTEVRCSTGLAGLSQRGGPAIDDARVAEHQM